MREAANPHHLKAACERFNIAHPVGSEVQFQRCTGAEWHTTRVRHEAYVLSGHSAVCFLDGVSGCFSIDFTRPVQ